MKGMIPIGWKPMKYRYSQMAFNAREREKDRIRQDRIGWS
jgi:hypothetical protein